jgi:hypothetical protein
MFPRCKWLHPPVLLADALADALEDDLAMDNLLTRLAADASADAAALASDPMNSLAPARPQTRRDVAIIAGIFIFEATSQD